MSISDDDDDYDEDLKSDSNDEDEEAPSQEKGKRSSSVQNKKSRNAPQEQEQVHARTVSSVLTLLACHWLYPTSRWHNIPCKGTNQVARAPTRSIDRRTHVVWHFMDTRTSNLYLLPSFTVACALPCRSLMETNSTMAMARI